MATLQQVPPPPGWVDGGANVINGLDLLGLRTAVQSVGTMLLSGVTTVSPTVRYVSLYAWIARRYAEARLPDSWESFRDFAGRVEAAVAIGNLLADRQTTGLAGRDLAIQILDEAADAIVLKPLIGQLAVGAYGGPVAQLRVSFPRETGVPGLSEERGLPLAEAVERTLGETQFARLIARDPGLSETSRDLLTEVGVRFPIASPAADERAVLLEAILPEHPEAGEVSRVATYGLLLELAADRQRRVREDDLFEAAIAPATDVAAVYRPYLDGWVRYLVRDMVAVVHEAALAAIIDEMAAEPSVPARAPLLMEALLARESEMEEPLRRLGLLPETAAPLDEPLDALAALVRAKTSARTDSLPPRWAGPTETSVIAIAPAGGAGRLALLPVAWLLARERLRGDHGPAVGIVPGGSGWFRMGVDDVILPGLEDLLRRGVTIRTAIREIAFRSVEQHLRVAWTRMAAEPRRDVALLSSDADMWYFRKRFRAGRTASRLPQAIGWLSQLGLLNDAGCTDEGHHYRLQAQAALAEPTTSR